PGEGHRFVAVWGPPRTSDTALPLTPARASSRVPRHGPAVGPTGAWGVSLLGAVPHARGQDSVPRKPCTAPKGSRQQGAPRRWRRCWAIDGDGAWQTPPTTLHACAPLTSWRVTGHALPGSPGAFPASWLVRVMRQGTVADRCDVNKLHVMYLTKKNHSNRLLRLRRAAVKAWIRSGGTPRWRVAFSSWPIGFNWSLRSRPFSVSTTRTARLSSGSSRRTANALRSSL